MKKFLSVCGLCLGAMFAYGEGISIETFPLNDVDLLDSPFRAAETLDKQYVLALDADRLLAPFQREAGLPHTDTYGNWEGSGLDGHIGGHYLSALSLLFASTQDKAVLQRLNYMIAELKKCQDKNGNGYLGGIPDGDDAWKALAKGQINVDNFSLNEKWVPWYNLHKVFAGLRDAWLYTGNKTARNMLIKLSDWAAATTQNLTDVQMQQMLRSEYGGMNEVFVDVADITGDEKYLQLARRFSQHLLLDPLLKQQDRLTGMHANTQIPKVIGFKRIADATGDKAWNDAAQFFWETVVDKRTVAIGGNSVKEHFHPEDDFSSMIEDVEGPETCNTYNMLKLSKLFYQSSGALKYLDFYERGLYNHILSSQNPDTGGLVYFTPMRPNHYRVYSQVQKGMWCCVGSGIESHAKYGELIYAHQGDNLYINLFIPSTLNWREKNVQLTQLTNFPDAETSRIQLNSGGHFTLNVRYPQWVAEQSLKIEVNGKPLKISAKPGSYVAVKRHWKKGDEITVHLPMRTHLEQLPDHSNYYAVLHGPIVLAAKTNPFPNEYINYFADDSRMGHIPQGKMCPLEAAPIFVKDSNAFLQKIKPVPNQSLTYTVPVVEGDQQTEMTLIPFFRLHDSRYMVYWPVASTTELASLQKAAAAEDEARLALAEITIDSVSPGEQQPESDHFIQSEDSDMGVNSGRHWRDAKGWFSYVMSDKNHAAKALQVTYFSGDAGREFTILVNGKTLAEVELTSRAGEQFYQMNYAIPSAVIKAAKDGKLVVKFIAKDGSIAGGIYDLRLLR